MLLKRLVPAFIAVLIMVSFAMAGQAHRGVVLEAANGGGYTYLKVKEDGNEFWLAGPDTQVAKGATVSFSEQIWMKNFTSKALNRTFDRILFVDGIAVEAPGAKAGAAEPKKAAKKTKAAKAYTVEEVYNNSANLKGRTVKVHGKVVKVSENIMGRNWVHIQDGTGSDGSNKLVFRSKDGTATVGSEITAQGVVETDKDFGFGYFYAVIVEDATFTK